MTTTPTPASPATPPPAEASPAAHRDELTPGHLELGENGFSGSPEWRSMVTLVLVLSVVLFLGAFAINAYVDPAGISGSGRYRVQVVEGSLRTLKAGLLTAAKPEPRVVVFGSSTSRNANPATITRLTDGLPAFNVGMSAGKPSDMFAMASLAGSRFADTPHGVYLIDVDQTFFDTPPNAGLRTTPSLWKQFNRTEQLRIAPAIFRPYFGLEMLKLSTLHAQRASSADAEDDPRLTPAAAGKLFLPNGYRRRDPYGTAQRVQRTAIEGTRYIDAIYRTGRFRHLDSQGRHFVQRFIDVQRHGGDRPVFVVLPPNPVYRREADSYGYEDRRRKVLAWLRSESAGGRATVVDATDLDTFGGRAADFSDNVHMTEPNMDRLLAYLDARGLLAPDENRVHGAAPDAAQ